MTEAWISVIYGAGVLLLGTIILVVILILAGSFAKARVARRDEEKHEQLLQRYEDLARRLSDQQEGLAADTSDVRRRVTEIERMLREVD